MRYKRLVDIARRVIRSSQVLTELETATCDIISFLVLFLGARQWPVPQNTWIGSDRKCAAGWTSSGLSCPA